MSSLYDVAVPTYVHFTENLINVLDKAEKWAKENGKTDLEMMSARLYHDMHPLTFQINILVKMVYDFGTLVCGVEGPPPPEDWVKTEGVTFDDLKKEVRRAHDFAKALPANSSDGKEDKEVLIIYPKVTYEFIAKPYTIEYGLSNFHFHFTTAYAIFRSMGVPLGKNDYQGHILKRR